MRLRRALIYIDFLFNSYFHAPHFRGTSPWFSSDVHLSLPRFTRCPLASRIGGALSCPTDSQANLSCIRKAAACVLYFNGKRAIADPHLCGVFGRTSGPSYCFSLNSEPVWPKKSTIIFSAIQQLQGGLRARRLVFTGILAN